MKNMGISEYSELIEKVLIFLKDHKISQNTVAEKINYYSLSKAKNCKKYPQKIIEKKSRAEVLSNILNVYGIIYDEKNETFKGISGDFNLNQVTEDTLYYVIYYFSSAKQIVGKGLVTIKDKKWASIHFNDPNHTSSTWKGNFEVVENYTFLYMEKKGDTTPIKALYSFFSGTIKHGRPILIGTYNTIKRDGSPTAGNVVLEKVETQEKGLEKINDKTNPKVTVFLRNKNFTVQTITPPTIDDLPKLSLSNDFFGEYYCYWPYKNGNILKGTLTVKETADIEAVFENRIFNGSVKYSDNNTLFMQLRNSRINRNLKNNDILAYLNINNYNSKSGLISGVLITPSLLAIPVSFPILLVKKNQKISISTVNKYFNYFSSPPFTALEPLELLSLLNDKENYDRDSTNS